MLVYLLIIKNNMVIKVLEWQKDMFKGALTKSSLTIPPEATVPEAIYFIY